MKAKDNTDEGTPITADPYSVEVHADGSFLVVRSFSRPVTLDIAVAFTQRFTALGEQHDIRHCLIDVRGTYDDSSILDKFNFAYTQASEAGLSPTWRVAVLRRPDDHSADFIETVMTNAGYVFKLFDDQIEALEWLGVLPPA